MKRIAAIFLAMVMIVTSLAFGTIAFADDESAPKLKLGTALTVTVPKQSEEEVLVAQFVPKKTGYYSFMCSPKYKNTKKGKNEYPKGTISIYEHSEGHPLQFAGIFMDLSKMSPVFIDLMKSMKLDVKTINQPQVTSKLYAGRTYDLMMKQDGEKDYVTKLSVSKHTHKYVKAPEQKVEVKEDGTSDGVGGVIYTCSKQNCNFLKYHPFYPQIEGVYVKNAVYTGKPVTPAVTVNTVMADTVLPAKYYSVKYKNNEQAGVGTAIIKFKKGYVGTVVKKFKIFPQATEVKKAASAKNQIAVKCAKAPYVTGYLVQAATDKAFTKNKTAAHTKGAKNTLVVLKKVKPGKTYFVRACTYYLKEDGSVCYSAWSAPKTVTAK